MAKYTNEFKKRVVDEYLKGKIGSIELAKKYDIKSDRQVRQWVKTYKELGEEGLFRSKEKKSYSFEFKLHMVELYLSSEVSYQELSLSQGISNYTMISKWVNDFRIAGPDALRPRMKGRKRKLKSSKKIKSQNGTPADTSAEHVKQLEDELLKLRIENAYLKERRRLHLEKETLLKQQRESSTASEEDSN